ncbi:MAG: cobalamin-binding protein [Marinilabiliales bacterium]|nr:MAG: cobalamin-binding protein [Marinilabiliales bacterium]
MKDITYRFEKALLNLDKVEARRLLDRVGNNFKPLDLVSKIVVPALERIGDAWQDGSVALSQIYMSGRICEQLIDELLPPSSDKRKHQPKMAIAVLDDFHFLGKRIVHSHIRSAGFEIKDYGRKTVDELVSSITEDDIDVIFISTLMYPSALNVQHVKEKLSVAAPKVKIVVGGAPFNMDTKLWQQVGADAMGHDGGEALKYINKMMEE